MAPGQAADKSMTSTSASETVTPAVNGGTGRRQNHTTLTRGEPRDTSYRLKNELIGHDALGGVRPTAGARTGTVMSRRYGTLDRRRLCIVGYSRALILPRSLGVAELTTLAAEPLSIVLAREIDRFVASSPRMRGASLYRGRRASARYHRSSPIFVAQLTDDLMKDVRATLHDISTEGIGSYCDRRFSINAILGIKLFWSDPGVPRVPVCVRHQQATADGILIGAQFVISDAKVCRLLEGCPTAWYG